MISVDTNILIRILVDDPSEKTQVNTARKFAKDSAMLFVSQIVQVELVWVLSSAYDLSKQEIVDALHHLYENEAYKLQNEKNFEHALHLYQSSSTNFSDCLILAESQSHGFEVVTFDKKFGQLSQVKLLTSK